MKYIICLLLLLLSSVSYGGFYKETITVEDTAIGVSASAKDPELKSGFFQAEGGNVRFWFDGTDPTSGSGFILYDTDSMTIKGINNLSNLRFIRVGSTTTTIKADYTK